MIFIWLRRIIWFMLLLCSLGTFAGCVYYYHVQSSLPDVASLRNTTFETPLQIYTKDNKLIAEFGEHRRIPKEIKDIPEKLRNAFLAIEDSRFYQHFGIDPVGIIRAASVSVTTGRKAQGASTITQQVARNFFLSNEKTYTRKIKEIFLSWKIEQTLTKDEIFELYLNKIALGHHAYGVAAAAYVYFGKTLEELTLGEAAIIAGLPKAPSNLNPITNPKRAKERRHLVLSRMLELGMISKEEFQEADEEEIVASYHVANIEAYAPYVAESVRLKLEELYGPEIYTAGYKVYTTIDSKLQDTANSAVNNGITDYDMRHGFRRPENILKDDSPISLENEEELALILKKRKNFENITPAIVTAINAKENSASIYLKNKSHAQIAWQDMKWARSYKTDSYQGAFPKKVTEVLKPGDLIYVTKLSDTNYALRQVPQVQSSLISIDVNNGAILAMVGGYSFLQSKFNRVEQAKRQVGSNIKPFLYSAALADGYTLGSEMLDDRITIWNAGSRKFWSPKNSPNRYEGPMTLREALAKSKNVVSVRLIRSIGVNKFVKHFEKFGFHVGRYQKNDSIALGAYEVKPIDLVTGYAAFANGGFKVEPFIINLIKISTNNDEEDRTVFEATPAIACPDCENTVEDSIELTSTTPTDNDNSMVKLATIDSIEGSPNNNTKNIAPQIITHANSFLTSSALSSVIFGGIGPRGRYWGTGGKATELKRSDISGKTGTTNESRDAWFSGFNANIATTVWVGFDNFSRPLGRSESGGKAALPIWINYMKVALQDMPNSPVLPDETIIKSDVLGYSEYFIKGSQDKVRRIFQEAGDFSVEQQQKEESVEDLF